MSADRPAEFVDANILVYAFDASAGAKQVAAARLLDRLWDTEEGRLSVQVLQEFFVTVTSKVAAPLSIDEAEERVREFAAWQVFAPTAADVLGAIALQRTTQYSFWDAMILHAAAESGCGVCWSEDLRAGQVVRGVEVKNPFA
ncbi:twitching motility protein PilT [Luteitalea sp. TBR-22]|uniref:PIN domain-containing protein n=1 Tax=Luteitalea sp. TBR-22 TaxID=2802971 RepID=UPI001AF4E51D|nr:PIN domain-containing protein [Luteitalea sp. TBR-22]BCS32503.1 twitching motility protein PilT [Luteitalea sp. TBR-22]